MSEKKTESARKAAKPVEKVSKKKVEAVKPEKKATPRAKKVTPTFVVEFMGRQTPYQKIYDLFLNEWQKSRDLSEIKALSIYYKVEENTAYCLVNETESIILYV